MSNKPKCQVVWGNTMALTEEGIDKCENPAEYVAYLDCQHSNTVAFKENSPARICKHHVKYLMEQCEGTGICGCHWIVQPVFI